MSSCPSCGSAISPDARFCGQCGHTIDLELTRRVPITVDEATRDPEPVTHPSEAPSTVPNAAHAPAAKPTLLGASDFNKTVTEPTRAPTTTRSAQPTLLGASDLSKTIQDNGSVERILAGLEWNAPPSEPKLVSAAPPPPTPSAAPTTAPGMAPSALPTAPAPPPAGDPTQLGTAAPTALGVPVSNVPAFTTDAPAEQARKPMFGATMIGGSVTAAEVLAESTRRMAAPAPEPKQEKLATMVGHAVLDKPAFETANAEPAASPSPADPQAFRPAFKTMLGVALPGIAPVRDSERSLAAAAESSSPAARGPMGTLHGGIAAPSSSQQRVAPPASSRPATAPLAVAHPHQHRSPAAQPKPVPAIVPPPAPIVEEPLPQAPVPLAQKKKGISAVVVVSIIIVVVIAVGTIAAVFVLRSGAPLSAKARLDESGKESLEIHCESCPDETKITLGASQATVAASTALLPLPAPLKIGENDLDIAIDRPGAGRDETVKVHVPIAYRVKADLTTLAAVPPVVTVRVEATPGTEVTVDDKPVALDGAGKGSYAIDVSADALGPSDDQKAIDRKIPFSVQRKGAGGAEPGTLLVRAAIVPLHLDAPGAELFTESTTANLVGQTKPGGGVSIDGQAVAVDANGRFAMRAVLPAEGEKVLSIVATAPPLAPRTVRAKVTRVPSLEAQAKTLDATTPLGFDAYGTEPSSKLGSLVVINGEILEIRSSPGYAIMVVEEKKTCAAGGGCILRLSMGEDVKAVRGDTIRAYGHVAGTVAWNNKTVPAITGTLAIAAKGAAKKQ